MIRLNKVKYVMPVIGITMLSILLLSLVSCSDSIEAGDSKIKMEYLYTKWYSAYEEQSLDGEIYRPEGYKDFAPSRYRRTYTFQNHGKCKWLVLSPSDSHYEMECYWNYDQKENTITIITESGKAILRLKIVELNKDLLLIQTEGINN